MKVTTCGPIITQKGPDQFQRKVLWSIHLRMGCSSGILYLDRDYMGIQYLDTVSKVKLTFLYILV